MKNKKHCNHKYEIKTYLKSLTRDSKEFSEALRKIHVEGKGKYDEVIAPYVELPLDVLEELVNSKMGFVRAKVATNPKLSRKQILKLSRDILNVKQHLATNTTKTMITSGVFVVLSNDESPLVRANVAANMSTPQDVLDSLSTDENDTVRLKVAMNIKTRIATLEFLEKDSNEFIARKATESLRRKRVL